MTVSVTRSSAIIECADAAHGLGGHICGDGGCTVPGDVAKGFGGGADLHDARRDMFAASTNRAARSSACKTYRRFYGMSSDGDGEVRRRRCQIPRQRRQGSHPRSARPGRKYTVQEILGGLRSTCTCTSAPARSGTVEVHDVCAVTQQINEVYGSDRVAEGGWSRLDSCRPTGTRWARAQTRRALHQGVSGTG